jgi:hypothetical protein
MRGGAKSAISPIQHVLVEVALSMLRVASVRLTHTYLFSDVVWGPFRNKSTFFLTETVEVSWSVVYVGKVS